MAGHQLDRAGLREEVFGVADSLAEIGAVAGPAPFFGKITLYNNLPYIEALEDGHSTQAAQGMVAVTLANLRAALA